MPDLLTVENLKVALEDPESGRRGWVLRGVDLRVAEGERLALVGESGCGKSVTALTIMNLLPQPPMEWVSGKIILQNLDLKNLPPGEWRRIRGGKIAMVFQEPFVSLNPNLRVGDQIEEAVGLHAGLRGEAARERISALLREVGLADPERIARQYPHQLSGGMCQRVMIAMAVSCLPSLLIADEPTTALDVTVQAQILEMLFRLTEERHLALLFITHNLTLIRGYAHRVAIFYAGQVVEEGTPEDIFDHPQHPYTEGLLAALPDLERRGKPLFNIPGNVPSPFGEWVGCCFADRCSRVQEPCRQKAPELVGIQKGHRARCFYPSKK